MLQADRQARVMLTGLILGLAVTSSASDTQASAIAPPPTLEAGVLPASWAVLGPECVSGRDFRAHEYNPTFIIIRQSGCTHYEKPFLYLLIGTDEALLFDTGAPGANLRPTINALMQGRQAPGGGPLPLLVLHSHGHGDHVVGDGVLATRPNTRLIAAQPTAIAQFFGLTLADGHRPVRPGEPAHRHRADPRARERPRRGVRPAHGDPADGGHAVPRAACT